MNVERAILANGESVEYSADDPMSGAMKDVYFTTDRRSVVCFYKSQDPNRAAARRQRLEAILGRCNPTLEEARGGQAANEAEAAYYRELFCWPTTIVVRPRLGFLAPRYPDRFIFKDGFSGEPKEAIRFFGAKNRRFLERRAPDELGKWPGCFWACLSLASAARRLHMLGLAHSDLSPNNVLIDPLSGRALVLDVDSLVVPGIFSADVLGTSGYMAPEIVSTQYLSSQDPKRQWPNIRTDRHSLAVLIHQLLLRRHPLQGQRKFDALPPEEEDSRTYGAQAVYSEHPDDSSNRPNAPYTPSSVLGSRLNGLFRRAFVEGLHTPDKRPSAAEWEQALLETIDLLQPCSVASCATGWLAVEPSKPLGSSCLDCKTRLAKTPMFLRLRKKSREGHWLADRDMVVRDGLTLHDWHAYSDRFPGAASNPAPLARVENVNGRWLLRNLGLSTLWTLEGNRVPIQGQIELKENLLFAFSADPATRVAEARRGPIV